MTAKNAVLDTTVFYEKIKLRPSEFDKALDRSQLGKLFAVNYSIIELNLGLIQTWIRFYKLVEEYDDVSAASLEATNWMGRGSKAAGLIQGLNMSYNAIIPCGDVVAYLAQLESTIANTPIIFEQLVKDFIGDFKHHPLARFHDLRREDYDEFMKVCRDNKLADVESFLIRNDSSIILLNDAIIEELKVHKTQSNKKMSVLLTVAKDNPKQTRGVKLNQSYGDIIISIDTPSSYRVVSKDNLFDFLCRSLLKDFKKFSSSISGKK